MTLTEIAQALVAGCRDGTDTDNLDRLYAPDAISVEAVDMGQGRETHGLDGIKGKHAWWKENFEAHDFSVSDPMPHGDDRFAVIFEVDSTEKASGKRSKMHEVAVYHVADGWIVREEFFYGAG